MTERAALSHRPGVAVPRPGSVLTAPGKDLVFLAAPAGHLRFREDVGPDAPPVPLHRHLRQTERFTVIEGVLLLTVEGRVRSLGPGESLEVAPRQSHSYAPDGAEGGSALIEVELWPALDGHRFFEAIYGLTRAGRLPPRGFRDVVAFLALCHAHRFALAGPPAPLFNGAAAVAASLAGLLRIDAWQPQFAAHAPRALDGAPLPFALGDRA